MMHIHAIKKNFLSFYFNTYTNEASAFPRICGDLQENIQMLKKLTQSQFTADEIQRLIISNCGTDNYNEYDREFPFRLLETISGMNLNIADRASPSFGSTRPAKWIEYIPFDRDDAEVVRTQIGQMLLSHSFSIRHYTSANAGGSMTDTPPSSNRIQSDFAKRKINQIALTAMMENSNDHSTSKTTEGSSEDWILKGDAAFTDWIFCIDGVCPSSTNSNAATKTTKRASTKMDAATSTIAKRSSTKTAERRNSKMETTKNTAMEITNSGEQYYDEIDIDFLEITRRDLSDVLVLASSDFEEKIPEIKLGIKVPVPIGKLIYLPEMLFSRLYGNKKIPAAWLNMLDSEQHAKTLLDTIEKYLPSFRVYIPGSVKIDKHWNKIPMLVPEFAKLKKKIIMSNKTVT